MERALSAGNTDTLGWLATAALRPGMNSAALFGEFCERLRASGLPLWRAALQLENLHPLYYGYCLHWYAGTPAYEVPRTHTFAESEAFQRSPYLAALRSGGVFRQRLEGVASDLPLLGELQAAGATDLLAEVIDDGRTMPPGVSWATRRPGGFDAGDIAALRGFTPYLGLCFGSLAGQRKTEAVLRTYLGAGPGREVMNGHVRRGDTRDLEAVVLLTDLRGFSAKSLAWAESELLEALNAYFEVVADSVAAAGGEVLKFIGDGVLAIFPVAEPNTTGSACRAAAAAVQAAHAALAAVNAGRRSERLEKLAFVAVLHAGPVSYGNIGAAERLDFTVVGAAVNIASRIEPIAKAAGEPTLCTSAVAQHIESPRPRSIGLHPLRGIPERIELFAVD